MYRYPSSTSASFGATGVSHPSAVVTSFGPCLSGGLPGGEFLFRVVQFLLELRVLGCGGAHLLISLICLPLRPFSLLLGESGLTSARVEEQAVPFRSECFELGLCLFLVSSGTGYLSPLSGHGGQVLHFIHVFVFVPG